MLEDAHRKVDLARLESEKADDEAIYYKTEAMKWKGGWYMEGYDAIKRWEKRALKAEAELARMKKKDGGYQR